MLLYMHALPSNDPHLIVSDLHIVRQKDPLHPASTSWARAIYYVSIFIPCSLTNQEPYWTS